MNKINELLEKKYDLTRQVAELDDSILKSIFEEFPQISTIRFKVEYRSDDEGGNYSDVKFHSINSKYLEIHEWEHGEISEEEEEVLLELGINFSEGLLIFEALKELDNSEKFDSRTLRREEFIR